MRTLRHLLCGRLLPAAIFTVFILSGCILLAVLLPACLAPLFLAERGLSLITALAVAGEHSTPECRLSKTVLLLLLPWTGIFLCLFLFHGDKTPPVLPAKEPDPLLMGAGALSGTLCSLGARPAETAEYFPTGEKMAARLLTDLKGAKKSVYLQYYIIEEGKLWGEILSVLEQKAKSGADVKVIYDDFGCALRLPPHYERELKRRGIGCAVSRPLRIRRGASRRDHRKIAVIDGEIAYTGGVNLADEYIGEKIRFGHWKDTAVRVTGAAAGSFSVLFARAWNACSKETLRLPPPPQGGRIPAAVLCDGAEEGPRAGETYLLRLFAGAREELLLTTPYLAPDAPLMHALSGAARAGADVRLMIPRIPDKKLPFLVTRSYAEELSRQGVEVRMYEAGFLHGKCVVCDGLVFLSSYNLDHRSLYLQAECGIAVRDDGFCGEAERDFFSMWETGIPLPAMKPLPRFFASLLRLFSPLL